MKKKITLREIAKLADVSAATASIVLNEKKNQGISQKTWDRVKKIAKKNNYTESFFFLWKNFLTIIPLYPQNS